MASSIFLSGKKLEVEFSEKKFLRPKVIFSDAKIFIFNSTDGKKTDKKILEEALIKYAREVISEKTKNYAPQFNFEYLKVSIKDQSSVWGSCSSRKNLNFNWRLILAEEPRVLDYVIIHELTHTKIMNHSRSFWDHVEMLMPEYRNYKEWLKKRGHELKEMIRQL